TNAFTSASSDFKFAAAAAGFAQVLKRSEYKGSANFDWVLGIASENLSVSGNVDVYRKEFVELVKKARSLEK
ncbi:MAG: DUF3520 domain-containing protein, partial [Proteobacteria bacterium]